MRIAKYQGESDLAKLVSRLYVIQGPGTKALAKEAELALLRANPQLEEPSKITKGAILVVPYMPKAAFTDESKLGGIFSDEALAELQRLVQSANEDLQESHRRHAEELGRTMELIKSPALKKLAKSQPEAAEAIVAIGDDLKRRLKENESSQAIHKKTFPKLRSELERLSKLLT